MSFLQLIIGYVIARIILAVVMVPHYFKGEIYSPYQLFSNAFGESARRTAGGFFILSETLSAGVRVYVACIPVTLMLGHKLLGAFGGGDAILGAILLFVVLSLLYTCVGGVKAVIWTDAVQFGLFLLGGLFTLCYIPRFFAGGAGEVFRSAAAGGKLHWFNGNVSWSSLWQEPINIWMGVIGGTFMVMSSHGAEQLIVQRVLACKTVRDGRRALILSAVVILPLFLIFLLVGAMLWVYYQKFSLAIPVPEVRPGSGIKANDFIFPIFILTAVPHFLKGLLIVAILAAAMSSVSSALTSLASVSTMDFAKRVMPDKSDGILSALQPALHRALGRGPHCRGLSQPGTPVCARNGLFLARPDQRRVAGGIIAGRVVETGRRPSGHCRHALLAGGDDLVKPSPRRLCHLFSLVHHDRLRRDRGRGPGPPPIFQVLISILILILILILISFVAQPVNRTAYD